MQSLAAYACALAAGLFLGHYELHTDDTGVEVAFILVFSFALGFWQPRRAWLFSLLGLCIPCAQLGWGHATFKTAVPIALIVTALSTLGAFSGSAARR